MHLKKSPGLLFALVTALTASAHGALYDRGNGMVYDSTTNRTGPQGMNHAKTCCYSTWLTTWADATFWTLNLKVGGFSDWHPPAVRGQLFSMEPGNSDALANTGSFLNLQTDRAYWLAGPPTLAPNAATFSSTNGSQLIAAPETHYYATAVRVGDVPVPAAIWLLGGALVGLASLARRQ